MTIVERGYSECGSNVELQIAKRELRLGRHKLRILQRIWIRWSSHVPHAERCVGATVKCFILGEQIGLRWNKQLVVNCRCPS